MPCRLVISGSSRPLAAEIQLALLRVAQEAIANARKHARATRHEVHLDFRAVGVALSIADDGRGFDPASISQRPMPGGGFGLLSMANRLQQLGGTLAVRSGPGNGSGTTVVAAIPYPAFPEAPHDPRPAPETTRFRVVVVDDHPATRAGLAALLDAQPDLAVIGQAGDGEEGVRLISASRPEVALIDLRLPKLGGVETIARLTRARTPTRIIVVTTFAQDELVLQDLRAGAQGYVLKDANPEELAAAVRTVGGGGTHLTPLVPGKLAGALSQTHYLTPREREVLHLIGQGLADKEIAVTLGASAKTVQFHVANVLDKLGAQNRTDAVRIAYTRGLIDV